MQTTLQSSVAFPSARFLIPFDCDEADGCQNGFQLLLLGAQLGTSTNLQLDKTLSHLFLGSSRNRLRIVIRAGFDTASNEVDFVEKHRTFPAF